MERPNNLTRHVEPTQSRSCGPASRHTFLMLPSLYLTGLPSVIPTYEATSCHRNVTKALVFAWQVFCFHSSELCSNISSSEKDRFSLTSLTTTIHPLHLFSVFLELYWVPLFDIFGPSCSFIVACMIASL